MDCNCKNILNLQPICNPVVNVSEKCNPAVNITDNSQGTLYHDRLAHRDLPDQHPIEAITGLNDILGKLWTFTYEQASASDSWLIVHNLGRKPSVVIVDSADNVFYPAVQYIDLNTVLVTMNGATTGKAYLN